MNNFTYQKVSNPNDALNKISKNNAANFIAGGTNLIDLWKYNLAHPKTLVDINGLNDYKAIKEDDHGGLFLGALATNSDTAYHKLVEERYPLLSKAILAGASAQIRNSASNGGNLLQRTRCYYFYDASSPCNKRNPGSGCPAKNGLNRIHAILGTSEDCIAVFPSDMCIALAALEAVVHVKSPDGEREIEFSNFHRLPGDTPELDNNLKENELITGISLPSEGFAENYSYLKLRDRNSYAFALVSVATGMVLENNKITKIRIALGGIAHKPWRVVAAEEFLVDKSPTEENFASAANMILKGAKGFGKNDFKIELSKRAIVRNCIMALDPESQRPGAQPSL
ncbi:xanthine dehydrogenase family protein subunit M [Subsaximicrobium wynnwilliamsii]|uniref:Xanthine dehydrogenase family protein subunit M n=1 Tax=Subsaximicrobium wynnwilliamsii TaxID=291179 RepID=A0A5C6ZHA4_9FLAO|nr:xanthine dehydrogenase family protein subunit M [Subsaximicrobium wynnwilliamsii]TXD83156.1 xanthine dehydrogenase family protein subunit M [Subsaximicrobium wynnwilliamsii]TXD88269.1 xanthine dehydrogenase family protein subunit M [Subsaximicrobium wynnwilliamsii]TXE02990.1 xanthine dehydrogenase family protein subunit M [Subsaximicrobium wynnwilliamsii]